MVEEITESLADLRETEPMFDSAVMNVITGKSAYGHNSHYKVVIGKVSTQVRCLRGVAAGKDFAERGFPHFSPTPVKDVHQLIVDAWDYAVRMRLETATALTEQLVGAHMYIHDGFDVNFRPPRERTYSTNEIIEVFWSLT